MHDLNSEAVNFWQSKRVFITGHTGFKGSWLSLWLQMYGAELVGFALTPPTNPNLFSISSLEKSMTSVISDIRDLEALNNIISQFQPEIVFHLAAQPLVRHSYQEPIDTYSTNVMGTVHLFEVLRKTKSVKVIINITTDKCYENKEWHWGYRETDRLGGHDPYSNSKACSELVTAAYRDAFFRAMDVGLASARAGNVIGGGDWAHDRLIPDIVRSCMAKQTLAIRNPNAVRPWQHVLEPLHGYIMLAERLYQFPQQYGQSWNFGPNEDDVKPVRWIADYLNKRFSNQQSWVNDDADHPHEATFLKLDCAKAKQMLGWQPRWALIRALEETASWYEAYQAEKDMRNISLTQIRKYLNETKEENNNVNKPIYSCSVR